MKSLRSLCMVFAMLPLLWVSAEQPEMPMSEEAVVRERADIAAVIRFAAVEIAGETVDHPMVSFTDSARASLRSDPFNFAQMGVPRFVLMRFVQAEDDPELVELGFVLIYVDGLKRRCSLSVLLHCKWSSERVLVEKAHVRPTVPPTPETMIFIVPAARVPRGLLLDRSHSELLVWLVEHAMDEEDLTGAPQPCFIFALALDRMLHSGSIGLAVDGTPGAIPAPDPGSRSLDYDGWPVAVLNGTFNWRQQPHFLVKVVHVPPEGVEDAELQLLGVLDSNLRTVESGVSGRPLDGELTGLDIALLVAGVIGVLICLAGYALKRFFWAVAGLMFGACLGGTALTAFGMNPGAVFFGIVVGLGLLGLAVFAAFPLAGRLGWGAGLGLLVGVFATDIPVDPGNPIVPLSVGVGLLFALGVKRFSTILISSFLGACMAGVAAGHWLGVFDVRGWTPAVLRELYSDGSMVAIAQWVEYMQEDLQIFFVLTFVFFALGIAIQSVATRRPPGSRQKNGRRRDRSDRGYEDYDFDDDDDDGGDDGD